MRKNVHFFTVTLIALMLTASLSAQTNKEIKLSAGRSQQPKAATKPKDGDKTTEVGEALDNETDGMMQAMKQEVEMTKDPKLGYVPRERLMKAIAYTQNLEQKRAALPGINWTERGPYDQGGRTRAIMIDPNDTTHRTVFAAGVSGGLWKTTRADSSNANWKPVNEFFANLAITTLAYDSAHPKTMYFGTGEGWFNGDAMRGNGIWRSKDGGNSWSQLSVTNSNSDFYYVQRIVVNPSNGYVYAATLTGIWRSKDTGNTWKVVLNSLSGAAQDAACDIQIASNHILFAGMGFYGYGTDGIYKSGSGDSGTWVKRNTGLNGFPTTGFDRIAIACAPSNPNYIYVATQSTTNALGAIYKSTNGGGSWTTHANPTDVDPGIGSDITRGQAWYDLILAVDPNDTARVILGGIDLFKTVNGGRNWMQISEWQGTHGLQYVHADQHAIVFQPGSSNVVYFGNDGGVWLSTNGGATINDRDSSYRVTQFYACDINPKKGSNQMLAGAQDNGTHRFANAGMNGAYEVVGGDGAFCHISTTNPSNQFASYVYSNFYYSNDSGYTFSSGIANNNGAFVNASDYDSKKDILYSGNLPGYYLRWDSASMGGASYIDSVPAFNGRTVTAVAISPLKSSRVFFGTRGGKVVRLDSANSNKFTSTDLSGSSLPTSAYVSCIAINPVNVNYMIVTYSNYGVTNVWATKNGGTTWTAVQGNLPDMPVRWAMFAPGTTGHALLATELGVWTTDSINGSSTVWGTSNTGLANVRTDMLKLRSSDNTIIAATHGRGLYSTNSFGAPLASFSADNTLHCDSGTVAFTNTSSGGITYKWYFGDGGTSTQPNPVHHYSACGNYTVKLVVFNAASLKDSLSKTNYITIKCHATSLIASAGGHKSSCSGTAVTLGATAKGGVTYYWTPATGLSSSTLAGPKATPTTTTKYTLTSYNSTQCSIDTASVTITPSVTPTNTISASPGKTFCAGTSVTFTSTISGGGSTPSYQWKKNGSNVGTNIATYTSSSFVTGDKVYCILTSSAACAAKIKDTSNTDTLTVKPSPVAVAGADKSACGVKNTVIGSTGVSGNTYSWSPSTGLSSSTISAPVASPTVTTEYHLSVTNTSSGCVSKDSMKLTVNAIPTVTAGGNKSTCSGTGVSIGGTATTGVNYVWAPIAGLSSSTVSNPTANPTTTTKYIVTASVSSSGCTNKDSMTLTVNSTGTLSLIVNASPGIKVCSNVPVITFTATPTNAGSTPTFQWKKNGASVGKNQSIYYDSSVKAGDIITCTLTGSNSCVTPTSVTSNPDTIKVNPQPLVSAGGNQSICSGFSAVIGATATTGVTYLWSPATHLSSSTSSKPTANPTNTTTYVVTATNTSTGCTNKDSMVLTVNPSGTPGITISAPATKVCAGVTSITFTASPTNGGSTPSYQWKKNGSVAGTNSATYKDTVLKNGDIVYCVLTSSSTCVSPSTATSAADTIKVFSLPVVTADGNKTICSGNSATIGGSASTGVTYAWSPATHLSSSTSSNPSANPTTTTKYTVTATTTATGCTSVDSMTLTVNPSGAASITISAPATKVCVGATSILFTAVPANGGATPAYQWKKNGTNVGKNNTTYNDSLLANGDIITCTLTSSNTCASPSTATSGADTIKINALPTANAGGNKGGCSSGATSIGSSSVTGLSYSWAPATGLSSSTAANPNASPTATTTYTVTVTNNSTGCVNKDSMTLTITSSITPTIQVSAPSTKVCANVSAITFTAAATNGGTTPVYQWKKNGSNVGKNQTTYKDSLLSNGDIITCQLSSSATCATPATVTSNKDTIVINALPVANAGGNKSGCSTGSVTLGSSAVAGLSYSWLPSTGLSSSTSSSPTASPTATTTYTLTVTNNSTGCVNKDSMTLAITTSVIPNISIGAPSTKVCAGTSSVIFTASIANGGTTPVYQWKKNGINVGKNLATFKDSLLTNGDVITCLLTSNAACALSTTALSSGDTIKINPLPSVNAGNSFTVCNQAAIDTFKGFSPSSGKWSTTSSGILVLDSLKGLFKTLGTNGKYIAKYTYTDINKCTNSDTLTVNVISPPAVTLGAGYSVCVNGGHKKLPAASPKGGKWTGTGVVNDSLFDPSVGAGAYTVSYNYNNGSCTAIDTVHITVNSLPNISAIASKGAFCRGDSTSIHAYSNHSSTTYVWSPGAALNNSTGNLVNTKASLSTTTTFTVTGTDGNGCVNTGTVTVTINPIPVITASASRKSICNGDTATLSASSNHGVSGISWSPSSGLSSTTGTKINTTTSLTTTTTYTITVSDTNHCSNMDSIKVTVNALPTAGASVFRSAICAGDTTTLHGTSNNALSTFTWSPATGLSASSGSTVKTTTALTANTSYTLTVTDTNHCQSTGSVSVTVNSLPVITASIFKSSICNGDTTTIHAYANHSSTAFTWSPSSSLSASTGAAVTTTATTTTTYTITGTDANSCVNSDTVSIKVNPIVTPTISISAPSLKVCANVKTITFTAAVKGGGSSSVYKWRKGGSTNGTNSSTYKDSVAHNGDVITCMLTSNALCASPATVVSASDTVIVNPLPIVTTGGNDTICSGQIDTLGATGTSGYTYSWSPATGLSSSTVSNPVVSTTSTTNYLLTVTNSATGCVNKDSMRLTVDAHVTLTGIAGPTTLTVGNTGTYSATNKTASGYHWTAKGGTITSGQGTDTAKIAWGSSGNDSIMLWANCSDTVRLKVKVSTAAGNVIAENASLMIYPNPNAGQFTCVLSTPDNTHKVIVEVTNVLGERIFSSEGLPVNGILSQPVALNNAAAGIYFIRIKQAGQNLLRRVIVQQ